MKEGLVSIIVPAYNAETFLRENIESILGQTYQNIEVIYVCDGCKDGTVEILKQYEDDNRLIIHVEEENHGAAVSRNIGMNMANGDWIIFWDADDLFEPDMIEQMVSCAVDAKADMCCCYWVYFDDVPQKDVLPNNYMGKLYCSTYPLIETKSEKKHILYLVENTPCTKLVNKSIYKKEEVYFQNIPNSNDVYYSAVCGMNSERIVFIDKVLWHYRSSLNRRTLSTQRSLQKTYILEAYDKIYEYIANKSENALLMRCFYNRAMTCIFGYRNDMVYGNLLKDFENQYFAKWKMNDTVRMRSELSSINWCIYYNMRQGIANANMDTIIQYAKLELVKSLSVRGCSLWGAGENGYRLLEQLSQTDIKIQHLYDSSDDKEGDILYGYIVEKFGHFKEENIIVTCPQFFDEIRSQIKDKVKNIYNLEQQIWVIP